MARTPTTKIPPFEKALESLETIVESMEEGELSLEEALKQFEKGISLSKICQQSLLAAELKVSALIENNIDPINLGDE
jgi:exodeoxyribonuclease VII small subunit